MMRTDREILEEFTGLLPYSDLSDLFSAIQNYEYDISQAKMLDTYIKRSQEPDFGFSEQFMSNLLERFNNSLISLNELLTTHFGNPAGYTHVFKIHPGLSDSDIVSLKQSDKTVAEITIKKLKELIRERLFDTKDSYDTLLKNTKQQNEIEEMCGANTQLKDTGLCVNGTFVKILKQKSSSEFDLLKQLFKEPGEPVYYTELFEDCNVDDLDIDQESRTKERDIFVAKSKRHVNELKSKIESQARINDFLINRKEFVQINPKYLRE